MRQLKITVAMVLAVLSLTSPVRGTDRSREAVVNRADLEWAVAQRLQQEDTERAAIRGLLRRPEIRAMAEGTGLDLKRAELAIATLEGPELERLAHHAAQADSALAGGVPNTITISTVTLLLIIIIIILLA